MEWVANVLAVWGFGLLWWAGFCAAFLVLTKFAPCNPGKSWWADRRAALTDFCHWLAMPLFTSVGRVAFLLLGIAFLYGREPDPSTFAVRGWPLWVQCAAILLVQDFLLYWLHRLFHRPALWKYHAVHHSPEVLDWTSAARFHPVNAVAEFAFVDAAMLLMGFDPMALAILGPINAIYSAMVHANLNWTFGPLRYVFASPVFHRWHHTTEAEGLDRNFASTFPFLDLLFGTFYMPAQRPAVYGTTGEAVPRGFVGQVAYPVRGTLSWAKRHPAWASAVAVGAVVVGTIAWQRVGDMNPPEPEVLAEVAASAPEPRPLRLSRPPALPTCVAVNATAGRVLRGFADGTVITEDLAGQELQRHRHPARVNAVAFSPNGQFAASASGDGTVHVQSGSTKRALPHDGKNVLSVAVSNDGFTATGTVDGTARLWDGSGKLVRSSPLGAGAVHALAVCDGGALIVAARQTQVTGWNPTTDARTDFDGTKELVYAVAVSHDGGTVAAGGYDGKLYMWDRSRTAPRFVSAKHSGPIYSVAWSADGSSLLSGGADKVLRTWNAAGELLAESAPSPAPLFAVNLAADGRAFGSGKETATSELTTGAVIVPVSGKE